MNYKLLFIGALCSAAAGYYMHDSILDAMQSPADALPKTATRTKASRSKADKPQASTPAPLPVAKALAEEFPSEVSPAEEASVEVSPAEETPQLADNAATPQESASGAEPPAPASTKPAAAGSARVADVLASTPLLNDAKPNAEARYYIYLMSAGWCGPCNAEMPNIVKAYEGMKESGIIELVLVDFDDSPEDARAYMAKYGATFPAMMKDLAHVLPGIQAPSGIPFALFVDEMGNMVTSGYGGIATEWQKHITEYEKKNGLESSLAQESASDADSAAADDQKTQARPRDRHAVAKALRKVKWAEGKPNRRAKYYIYYQSASWCGPCCQLMPAVLEEYKAMKKDGRVELLHISCDGNAATARKYHKGNKAAFPMVLIEKEGVDKLPGWTASKTIPAAVIVDSSGQVLKAGSGDIVRQWRQLTIDSEDIAEQE